MLYTSCVTLPLLFYLLSTCCQFLSILVLLSLVQEWGDPRKEEYYYYMKSYSPVDNVSADLYVSVQICTKVLMKLG